MKEKNELDVVKEMLTQWVTAVKLRNSVNDMEINRTSENLVLRLLNLAYDYDLTNLNWEGNNYPAIDLGDREGGIALQVTSTSTLDKIKETLRKFYTIDGPHNEFTKGLYFFFLKEKPPRLKAEVKRKLKTNYGFDPDQQMWSMKTLLTRMEELYSKDRPRFNKVKKILEEEFGGKAMKLEDSITSQPKIVKPGLRTLRRLPPSEQPQDFFTAHISSIVDAGIAKYCPEKHQLYLQFNLDDPESLEKLKSLSRSQFKQPISKSNSGNKKPIRVLSGEERKLLGLLAVSTVPLKISYFAKCFPDKDWNKQFKKFIRDGLLQKKNDEICLSKKVRENLLSDPHEIKSFHQAWLEALESIKHYIDIPFYFALHYIALEKFDDAIIGMTDILIDMECGWENAIYLSLLETIAESKILTRINSESRVNFYNMMGLCLSRSGNHLEAIKWFLKLRSYSKRIKHFWGIGQSYINCGYAYFEINEIQKAERCYRKAVEHGKTTDDKWLLGRALHNLSMTIFSRDMGQAIKLMNESLKIKKEVEDIEGVATALFGYGNLAIEKGEIKEALRWYQKAERKAKKFNLTYLHSLALINIGRANTDLNNLHTAIDYFQRAKKIGASEGYRYTLFLALKNEAMARLEIEEFKKAEILFRDLYELEKSGGDFQEMLAALHNTGVALIKQKKYREARRILGQGLKLASKNDDREWIFHCHLTSASSHCEAGNVKNALQALSNHAQKEEKRGLHIVAGQLWEKYVALLIENNGKNRKIERTFKRCIQCFEKAEDNYFYLTRVCERLYLWRWDNGLSKEALAVLDKLEEIAKVNKQNRDRIRFIDQKGVCFQELGMFKRAEKAHRSALKLARRLNDLEAIMPSLQNLGELFRKTHRLEESIQTSEEAEKIAAELNDMESQISISHNRALTLRQSGNILKSEKILMQCRDRAKRNNLVYEYVRAIYGLADSAQIEGKNKLAERRYLEALKEAKINGLEEYKTEIIYNYSVLLRREKRFGEAVEILEEQREHFKNFSDATSYYISIANLYEEMGNLDLAKKYWEEAKKEAGHFSDQSTVTQCIDALERIAQHEKESQLTEDDFEKAIQKENDPKKKAVLMAKYVSLLLSMDREKKAEEILDTTMEIAKKNDFKDILLELYQTYGDYLWQKSSRLKYRSLQVYFVGLRETFDYNDSFVEIGKHIIDQLITIEPQKRHKQIQSFYERLSRWLRKPFEMINHSFTIDSVLWPLKVVMELPPIIGEEIPDHQIYLVSGKLLKRITEN